MRRSTVVRAAPVLLIVGAALVALVWTSSDDVDKVAVPGEEVLLGPQARELASLVARGNGATYHAVYMRRGKGSSKRRTTIEVWRDGARIRSDETVRSGDDIVRTSTFRLKGGSVVCTSRRTRAWTCREAPAEPDAADPILGRIAGELSDKRVAVSDDRIDGHRARCYELVQGPDEAEVCLTPTGVPLAYRIAGISLEIVELDVGAGAVEDGDLRPPSS